MRKLQRELEEEERHVRAEAQAKRSEALPLAPAEQNESQKPSENPDEPNSKRNRADGTADGDEDMLVDKEEPTAGTSLSSGGAAPDPQQQGPEEKFEKLLRESQQERNATRGNRTKLASKSSAKSTPYGT